MTHVAVNRRTFPFPIDAVWATLTEGHRYCEWVVGTRDIRDVDDGFPDKGKRLHYTAGVGPFQHDGHTEVLTVTPGESLELEAHAWPLGTAKIRLDLTAKGDRATLVTIHEEPEQGVGRTLHNPLVDLALKARNVETLRRLERAVSKGSAVDAPVS